MSHVSRGILLTSWYPVEPGDADMQPGVGSDAPSGILTAYLLR